MAERHLFNGVDIFSLMEDRKRRLKATLASISKAQTDDLALEVSLANDYRLDVPVLDDSKKYAKTREAEVDVSRDHRRFITDRSRPFYVAGMTFDSGKLCT